MRKVREMTRKLVTEVCALVLAAGIFGMTSLVSHAAQATVTSSSGAKIRQEASTTSTMVGGAEKGKVLNVLSEVQGSDGYTWYQVQNDTITGYVRSDLVEVTGEIGGGETGGGEEGGGEAEVPQALTEVNPVSATVYGEAVEIRDAASAEAQSLGTVPNEAVVTVTGYVAEGEEVWYQVNYNSEDSQINGFILSEYVSPSEDLTPLGFQAPEENTPSAPLEQTKRYETVEKDGEWLLVDSEKPTEGYIIKDLISGVTDNANLYFESEKKVKTQKIIIIVLVFLLVAAVAGIAFLVFKIRDIMDSAYFNEVEKDTLRKKNAQDGQNRQRVTHTVGADKQPGRTTGTRSQGTRTAGTGTTQRSTGTAAGQRAAGTSQDPRTVGSTAGQRTVGTSQDPRTAGTAAGQRTVRAQDPRMAGTAQSRTVTPGQRTAGTSVTGQRTVTPSQQRTTGTVQGQRTVNPAPVQRTSASVSNPREQSVQQGVRPGASVQGSAQKPQPKNFMTEEDEFDFEFLNYDGDDEQ